MSLFGPHVMLRAEILRPSADCMLCESDLVTIRDQRTDIVPTYQCSACLTFYHRSCAQWWWSQYGKENNATGHSCPICRAPWPTDDFVVVRFTTHIIRNARRDRAHDREFSVFTRQQFMHVLIHVCSMSNTTMQDIEYLSLLGRRFTVAETDTKMFDEVGITAGSVLTVSVRDAHPEQLNPHGR